MIVIVQCTILHLDAEDLNALTGNKHVVSDVPFCRMCRRDLRETQLGDPPNHGGKLLCPQLFHPIFGKNANPGN